MEEGSFSRGVKDKFFSIYFPDIIADATEFIESFFGGLSARVVGQK
jgi:hypothetical protein